MQVDQYTKTWSDPFRGSYAWNKSKTCFDAPSVGTGVTFNLTLGRTFTGYKNPSWKDAIKRHENATTDADGSIYEVIQYVDGSMSLSKASGCSDPKTLTQLWTGQFFNPGTMSGLSLPPGSMRNEAAGKLYDQVRNTLTQVQGGTILLEARKTIRSLRNPLVGIKRILKAHRERVSRSLRKPGPRQGRLRRINQGIRESWLEANFGILPLVGDIKDITQLLVDRYFDLSQEFVPVWGISRKKTTQVNTSSLNIFSSPLAFVETIQQNRIDYVRYKGVIRLSVGTDKKPALTPELLGVGFANFGATVWEVIPFSWLADYVTNIGTVLNAYSVPWSAFCWCCETQRTEFHRIHKGKLTPLAGWAGIGSPGLCEMKRRLWRRRTLIAPPTPSFEWDVDIGVRKALNVAAVFASFKDLSRRAVKTVYL